MDPARLNILINHVPIILLLTGTCAIILAMFRARHGIWMYASASLSLAAISIVPTYFAGGLAARVLGRPVLASPNAVDTHQLWARIAVVLIVVAGVVAAVAWRRLVRYPRELRMPWSLRAALVVTSLAAATVATSAVLLGE